MGSRPTRSITSSAALRALRRDSPRSTGTVATLSTTRRCGIRPGALDDVSDAEPQLDRIDLGDVLAVDGERARRGVDHPVDHSHRRGLAAARRSDEDRERALGNLQRQVVDRDGAVGILLGDVLERDQLCRLLFAQALIGAVSYFCTGWSNPLSLIHFAAASSGSTPWLPSTEVLSSISASVVNLALTASSTVLRSLDIF